ncbi:outer membrane protein transport protein [Desulfococcaceae bacterium HSG8]|nr:outer membrane protein transport protein [Desulfococcaceae bacterium HSG8]
MKKRTCHIFFFLTGSFLCLLLCLPNSAYAQSGVTPYRIEIPSSFNPVGSGARALGMGGAFIAVADDATAASWNPGGLIQLGRPEMSLVGEAFRRSEDNSFGSNPEASGTQRVTGSNINYFSLSYPFAFLNRNMILSLNYQHLFDFTREWEFPLMRRTDTFSEALNFKYAQEGRISAIGLACAVQLTPKLSLGVTLNSYDDWLEDNGWENSSSEITTGIDHRRNALYTYERNTRNNYSFSGFNANLGVLWHINDKVTLGAVVKTPFTADLEHKSRSDYSLRYPDMPEHNDSGGSEPMSVDEELEMPLSYGIGIAYRFSDQLTVSADIYRTEWGDFILEDAEGNKTAPVSGLPQGKSDIDPTHQIRIGAEYLLFDTARSKYVIPLRCGIFYDPAPAEGSPDDFYGFSAGTGIVMGKFVFDIAYQYRFGRDVGTFMLQELDFSQDINEHTLYSSVIIHF